MLEESGYQVMEGVYSAAEVERVVVSSGAFAIRRFLLEFPAQRPLVFTPRLLDIIRTHMGEDFFLVKSIYFDKPPGANWFVAAHQDLTIAVDRRMDLPGFGPWTVKGDQFAVQPPVDLLEAIYTVRIHLDDTDERNGALRVVEGSHRKGVYRPFSEEMKVCPVKAGGIMLMRPLLMHASSRTADERPRRVIHLEFCNRTLPGGIRWAEEFPVF